MESRGSAEFALFELCGSYLAQAADFLRGESLRYPLCRLLCGKACGKAAQ